MAFDLQCTSKCSGPHHRKMYVATFSPVVSLPVPASDPDPCSPLGNSALPGPLEKLAAAHTCSALRGADLALWRRCSLLASVRPGTIEGLASGLGGCKTHAYGTLPCAATCIILIRWSADRCTSEIKLLGITAYDEGASASAQGVMQYHDDQHALRSRVMSARLALLSTSTVHSNCWIVN